jgi:hypothetical protein
MALFNLDDLKKGIQSAALSGAKYIIQKQKEAKIGPYAPDYKKPANLFQQPLPPELEAHTNFATAAANMPLDHPSIFDKPTTYTEQSSPLFKTPLPSELRQSCKITDKYQPENQETLSAAKTSGARLDTATAQQKIGIALKAPMDIGTKLRVIGNAFGQMFEDNANFNQKIADTVTSQLKKANFNDLASGVQSLSGIVTTPERQIAQGLYDITGGKSLKEKPRIVKGAAEMFFSEVGATPEGAAFNAIISHPAIKPLAEGVFNAWDTAKETILKLPIVNSLPQEVKDILSVVADLYLFKKVHENIDVPSQEQVEIKMTDPVTGKTFPIKIPVDMQRWSNLQKTMIADIHSMISNPLKFFQEKGIGLTIKDVSGEQPKPDMTPTHPFAMKEGLKSATTGEQPNPPQYRISQDKNQVLEPTVGRQELLGPNFTAEQPPALPAPKYDPALSDKLMEEGSRDIKKAGLIDILKSVLKDWYDSLSPLLQEGKSAAPYLLGTLFPRKIAGKLDPAYRALKGIYETIPEHLQKSFDDLQVHKALIERGRQGISNPYGITTEQAEARVQDVIAKLTPKDKAILDAADAKIKEWTQKNIINPLVQAGEITPQMAKDWIEHKPDHLPVQVMHYLEDRGIGDSYTMTSSKKGFLSKAEGTTSLIDTDTFRVRMRQAMQVRMAIEKDRVAATILKHYGSEMKDSGITKEAFEAKNPNETLISDPATGKRYVVPRAIGDLMTNMNAKSLGLVEQLFSNIASFTRSGATTARVAFSVLTNPLRDPASVKMLMGDKFSYLVDLVPSIFESIADAAGVKSEFKQTLKEQGGLMSGLITSEQINLRASDYQPKTRLSSEQKVKKALGVAALPITAPYKIAKRVGEALEEGTREAAVRAWDRLDIADKAAILNRLNHKYVTLVVDPDVTPEDLRAFISARSTIDFNQKGDKMKIVNRLLPFFDVNFTKGPGRTLQLLMNDPKAYAINSFKYSVLPTLITIGWNQMLGGDDDIDSYTKAKYFALKTGLTGKNDQGEDAPILLLIPKGESGITEISNAVQGAWDLTIKKNPRLLKQMSPILYSLASGEDVRNAAAQQVLQLASRVQIPILMSLVEAIENYDFYRGRKIDTAKWEKIDWQKLTPEDMAAIKTPEMYKALARFSGLSPFRIRYFIENVYPAFGQTPAMMDFATGKPTWGDVNQFVPIIRPAYKEDTDLSAVYQAKDKAEVATRTENLKIRAKVDDAIAALQARDKAKAMEILQTIPEGNTYAKQYFIKQAKMLAKKQSGSTQADLVIAKMTTPEAIQYFEDNIRKTHDKQKLIDFLNKLDSAKVQAELVNYVKSTSGS